MIASWMLYLLAVSTLLAMAAHALDRSLVAGRRPTRLVWAAAIALALAWTVVSLVRRMIPAPLPAVSVPFAITVPGPVVLAAPESGGRLWAALDGALLIGWAVASLALLLRLGLGWLALQRQRRTWRRDVVDGSRVAVSPNVGPALVGLAAMEVVVPEWILSLDAPLRAIVLRHEAEHRRARDPHLLLLAGLAVAVVPWNVPVWLMARRLRLSIELDCDARVLRAHPFPERYGMLMLAIAHRHSAVPVIAPMLTESTTHLERRILAMRTTTRRLARLTLVAGTTAAALLVALATTLRSSELPIRPASARTAARTQQGGNPAPRYPDVLRSANVDGTVIVEVATDARGVPNMATYRLLSSTHDLFSQAVRDVIARWRLAPLSTVRVPFVFTMNQQAARTAAGLPPGTVIVSGAPMRPDGATAGSRAHEAVVVTAPATVSPVTPADIARAAEGPTPMSSETVYFEYQVEQPVSPKPGNPVPRYPDMLRSANVEGTVLAQFVVDPDGMPEMSTFKVVRSTHDLFTSAVKSALPEMRFNPAQVGGKGVYQLVQMPFEFNLTR